MYAQLNHRRSLGSEARGPGARPSPRPSQKTSPEDVMESLGRGQDLDGATRSRMQSALGTTLPDVRVHTDVAAAGVARSMGARAFSVGPHIGFAPGQYRPGTIAGDAMIAHELAHRLQQTDAPPTTERSSTLEAEADRFAVGAVGRMLSSDAASPAMPTQRTGLKLQGCGKGKSSRTGMGLDMTPLGEAGKRSYTVEEYRELWQDKNRKFTLDGKDAARLSKGCIGITKLNLETDMLPPLEACFDSFDNAKAAADAVEKETQVRPYIFSKLFYSGGREYAPDEEGKVDMSGYWDRKDRVNPESGDSDINYDYGWYDELSGNWWHANHCDPVTGDDNCRAGFDRNDPADAMKIYQSTLDVYSDTIVPPGNYLDKQVFCIAEKKPADAQ